MTAFMLSGGELPLNEHRPAAFTFSYNNQAYASRIKHLEEVVFNWPGIG